MHICHDMHVGVGYGGILARKPPLVGLAIAGYPTLWFIVSSDTQPHILCIIRLTEVQPVAGFWVPIWIDDHQFYAALDDLYAINPVVPEKELGGKTPRDFLNDIRDVMPAAK
jgi:hypothetical protein